MAFLGATAHKNTSGYINPNGRINSSLVCSKTTEIDSGYELLFWQKVTAKTCGNGDVTGGLLSNYKGCICSNNDKELCIFGPSVDTGLLWMTMHEFKRTKGNINSMREHAELLTSVRNDISEYKASGSMSPGPSLLRERAAIHGNLAQGLPIVTCPNPAFVCLYKRTNEHCLLVANGQGLYCAVAVTRNRQTSTVWAANNQSFLLRMDSIIVNKQRTMSSAANGYCCCE
eukprot:Gb_02260 [translate_table: standard]